MANREYNNFPLLDCYFCFPSDWLVKSAEKSRCEMPRPALSELAHRFPERNRQKTPKLPPSLMHTAPRACSFDAKDGEFYTTRCRVLGLHCTGVHGRSPDQERRVNSQEGSCGDCSTIRYQNLHHLWYFKGSPTMDVRGLFPSGHLWGTWAVCVSIVSMLTL